MAWLIAKKGFELHQRGERFEAVVDERMAELILAGYVERLPEPEQPPIWRGAVRAARRNGKLANPTRIQAKPDGQS